MSVSAIVTAHQNVGELNECITQLYEQSVKPDRILIYYSDIEDEDIQSLKKLFPAVLCFEMENENDWGHSKREAGVVDCRTDYLFFCNADDKYHNDFIKEMSKYNEDFIYCDFTTRPNNRKIDSSISHGKITSGNFLVKTSIAQECGYPNQRVYHADWLFIQKVVSSGASTRKVEKLLYYHQ